MSKGYAFYRAVEKIRLRSIGIAFILLWFICGLIYYLLTIYGKGLIQTNCSENVSIGDALYFSIITISSLGYGDIAPIHFGRVIVAIEVVLGLVLVGLTIAKITAERSGYLLKNLYGAEHSNSIRRLTKVLDRCYNNFTSKTEIDIEDKKILIGESYGVLIGLRAYIGHEIHHGELMTLVPSKIFFNLIKSCKKLLITEFGFNDFDSLNREAKHQIFQMFRLFQEISKMIEYNTYNPKLKSLCKDLILASEHQRDKFAKLKKIKQEELLPQ